MGTQLQQRVVSVAGRLSRMTQDKCKRINAAQRAILAEQAERKAEEERLLKGRLSRARTGLRRLLAFAASRPIQQIVKANERLGGNGISFYEYRWNVIGTNPTSYLFFSIGSKGIEIKMANHCWVVNTVSTIFSYKKREKVTVHFESGNRKDVWDSSSEEILLRMAVGMITSLYTTSEESAEAIRVFASWSRPAPFDRIATCFLERLEKQL